MAMGDFLWPVNLLVGSGVSAEIMHYLDTYIREAEKDKLVLSDLQKEHELLQAASAKQDRYIAELEKQLSLLQKTLDLIDKNGGEEDG